MTIFLDRFVQKSKHTFYVQELFPQDVPFMRQHGKILYSQTGYGIQNNMVHALCVLDNQGCRHTHTHTHTEYVILIILPQQQWLRSSPPCFVCTYVACLSVFVWFFLLITAFRAYVVIILQWALSYLILRGESWVGRAVTSVVGGPPPGLQMWIYEDK